MKSGNFDDLKNQKIISHFFLFLTDLSQISRMHALNICKYILYFLTFPVRKYVPTCRKLANFFAQFLNLNLHTDIFSKNWGIFGRSVFTQDSQLQKSYTF